MRILNQVLSLSTITFLFVSCSSDNSATQADSFDQSQADRLELLITGLEAQEGQHYEGWLVGSSGVISTGRFNVDESGGVFEVDSEGEPLSASTLQFFESEIPTGLRLSSFVLTIEPDGDADLEPSAVHLVAGNFSQSGTALATTESASAIGASFLSSSGDFILATPSNGPDSANQGIWYLDPSGPAASLSLPSLNEGWAYEAWIVNTLTGEVISTGVFENADEEDSDGPGETAGPMGTPAFPGQDFIDPAIVLNSGNYLAVISVEPFPDFDPRPFTLKILAEQILEDEAVMTPIPLNNISNEQGIRILARIVD